MTMHMIPRATERRSLSLMIKGRVKSRAVYCDLIDISEGGCKVRGSQGFTAVGDRVTMKVGSVNAPLGTVVWVDGKIAGIAFEGEMHAAVIDHLVRQQGAQLEQEKDDGIRRL